MSVAKARPPHVRAAFPQQDHRPPVARRLRERGLDAGDGRPALSRLERVRGRARVGLERGHRVRHPLRAAAARDGAAGRPAREAARHRGGLRRGGGLEPRLRAGALLRHAPPRARRDGSELRVRDPPLDGVGRRHDAVRVAPGRAGALPPGADHRALGRRGPRGLRRGERLLAVALRGAGGVVPRRGRDARPRGMAAAVGRARGGRAPAREPPGGAAHAGRAAGRDHRLPRGGRAAGRARLRGHAPSPGARRFDARGRRHVLRRERGRRGLRVLRAAHRHRARRGAPGRAGHRHRRALGAGHRVGALARRRAA